MDLVKTMDLSEMRATVLVLKYRGEFYEVNKILKNLLPHNLSCGNFEGKKLYRNILVDSSDLSCFLVS